MTECYLPLLPEYTDNGDGTFTCVHCGGRIEPGHWDDLDQHNPGCPMMAQVYEIRKCEYCGNLERFL